MDEQRLAQALSGLLGSVLAADIAADFLKIRRDLATRTLERSAPGKFVETYVQCLQHLDTGAHDLKPNVDAYLDRKAETTALPDGLRICGARVARAMYTFRNKRNIAHKNDVDTNTHDLAFVYQGAAWLTAELLRQASGITMQEAGALIQLIQAPVGSLVEDIDGTRLVHARVSVEVELLILFHSHYPDSLAGSDILSSLSRRSPDTVRKKLCDLHDRKLLQGNIKAGYKLTCSGHSTAALEISRLAT